VLLGRRARTLDDLLDDKAFLFHVGQLIGATQMVSHWMSNHVEGDVKDMGEKLSESSDWFFNKEVKVGE
jgi:hypothetical protein